MDFSLAGLSGSEFAGILSTCVLQVAPYCAVLLLAGKITRLVIGAITGKGVRF